jgi:hypothetical protein
MRSSRDSMKALNPGFASITISTRILPRIIKPDAIDLRQNLYHDGRVAHPKKSPRIEKIVGCQVLKRRAKLSQSFVNHTGVLFVGPYKDVKVFCRSWLSMESYRIATHDQILNLLKISRPTDSPRGRSVGKSSLIRGRTRRPVRLWAFKADKSSLKSGYIRYLALHRVQVLSNLRNRSHPLMSRAALPITVFVGLRLIEAGVLAKGLVHAFRL